MKQRKRLGNAEAATGVQFVQGGNQAQTFILIVLVFIIIFYVISNIPKLFDFILQNRNNANNGNNTNNANVTPNVNNGGGGVAPNTNITDAAIPSTLLEKYKVLQRLLNAAGSNLVIDGVYGANTNNALTSWSSRTGKGTIGTTSLEEWIRLLRIATNKTGLAGIDCKKRTFEKLIKVLNKKTSQEKTEPLMERKMELEIQSFEKAKAIY